MDGLYGKTLLKWMIWGYHYFWKYPSLSIFCAKVESQAIGTKVLQLVQLQSILTKPLRKVGALSGHFQNI